MSLFEERVDAAAKAMYELRAKIDDPFWEGGKLDYGIKQIYRQDARAALEAADEEVTEEQVERVLSGAFQGWTDQEDPFGDQARAVIALFRGGAK